jgi:rsbT co-antagonist protein RsbR
MPHPDPVRTDLHVVAAEHGLSLGGSRALVYSHVAIDMLRKQLVHQLGEDLARAIVAQAGRHGGSNDASLLLQERSFTGYEDMLAAQFEFLHASGFGRFTLVALTVDRANREAYVRVLCHGSPEAESHRRLFGASRMPACWHLVGYGTGWASAVTGLPLLTVESRCVARGDDHCELETMPYDDFVGPEAAFWKQAFESTSKSMASELQDKLTTIERQLATIQAQRSAIAELSAPILQVAADLLVLPIVGELDDARARGITEKLLAEVAGRRARGVIVDVTGVDRLAGETSGHLIALAGAVRLLGAQVVLTGISPTLAEILVAHDVRLDGITTLRTLEDGLRHFRA